jgi:hypothetical protein
VLVPFQDAGQLSGAVITLLCDDRARLAMGRKAYAASRPTVWAETAARYVECFRGALPPLAQSQFAQSLPSLRSFRGSCAQGVAGTFQPDSRTALLPSC